MPKIPWDRDAELALKRVPFFVRPLARRKVEQRVCARGGERVVLADFEKAEARFHSATAGTSDRELEGMVPRPNRPGAPLLIVETCHSELSHCPNVLLDTSEWADAINAWAKANDISERLRRRVKGERVLFHHKFRIAVAGCPNACSRPQIADIGIVGTVRPDADADACTACGACVRACPDAAIRVEEGPPAFGREACLGCRRCAEACPASCIELSEPAGRVMAGGKLGRHPRLAQTLGTVRTPADLIPWLDAVVNDYITHAAEGERFAEFWARTSRERPRLERGPLGRVEEGDTHERRCH